MSSAMKLAVLLLGFCFTISLNTAKELPSYINKCSVNSTIDEREKCMIKTTLEVIQILVNNKEGIPELILPSIRPYKMDKIEVQNGNQGSNGLHIVLENLEIWGLESLSTNKYVLDFDKGRLELRNEISNITVKTNYNMKGKLLLFDLSASGAAKINIGKLHINSKIKFDVKKMEKNGKHYMVMKDTKTGRKSENVRMDLGDVFPGNKMLSNQLNRILNENIEILQNDFGPLIYQSVTIFDDVTSYLMKNFAIEELFVVE